MPTSSDAVRLDGVHKKFGAVTALHAASLTLRTGEVRALMGGNGSGKSTLSKILLGIVAMDSGTVTVGGTEHATYGIAEARALRVAGTYQETSLLGDLSVAENLALPRKRPLLHSPAQARKHRQTAREALDRVQVPRSLLDQKVRALPLDQRCLIELAKVLLSDPRILVLDELTASLRHTHVAMVGELIAELATRGTSTVFVSHRLEEVEQFCTSVTVLRNGRTVLAAERLKDHSMQEYLAAMSGRDSSDTAMRTSQRGQRELVGDPILDVSGLRLAGRTGMVDLVCRAGEVVGLAGLAGNGQAETLRTIYGAATQSGEGSIKIEGREVSMTSVRGCIDEGIGFLSGDREHEMSFGVRTVQENVSVVATVTRKPTEGRTLLERMAIVGAVDARMKNLSGGNQQKVIVGRWLGSRPKVLLADDPTRGVNVTARSEIHRLLRELTGGGATVLLTSSDERELAEVCDRVYVMYDGRIITELCGDDIDEHRIAHASLDPSLVEAASTPPSSPQGR